MKFAFTSVVVTGVCVCGLTPGLDISHLITGCFVRCIQSQFCLKYIRYKSCIPHLYTIFYSFIGKLCLRIDVPMTNSFEVALSSCSAANCIITKCKRIRKGFLTNIILKLCMQVLSLFYAFHHSLWLCHMAEVYFCEIQFHASFLLL